jgi:hypothetical protein
VGGPFHCKVVTRYEHTIFMVLSARNAILTYTEVNNIMRSFLACIQIYKKELCFWDYPSTRALVKMCQTKQYPPRFILEASGNRATETVVARISFPGTKEFFKRTVPTSNVTLKCHPQGM